MPVQQAVEHPRFVLDAKPNFYKPGSEITVTIEQRVPAAALKTLEEWGHKLAPTSDFTAAAGGMQAIVVDLRKARCWPAPIRGAPDTRSAGDEFTIRENRGDCT